VCSEAFAGLARSQLKALGASTIPIALVPHPFGSLTRADLARIARTCAESIQKLALGSHDVLTTSTDNLRARNHDCSVIHVPEDLVLFNEQFVELGYGDGLPLVPPTPERVALMLGAAGRPARDVVARVAPGFGEASVERIAVNAVMAGCRPAMMPVLLAAIEALTDQTFNLQGIQATTNSAAPWVIVGGPIAQVLGFNSGANCLGQGNVSNATLGRAIRLVLQNIGDARPGQMDRATHGQPGKYSFCCAENIQQNPWSLLHEERGFHRDEDVVTVVGASGTKSLNSHTKDGDDLLRVIAESMVYPMSNDYHFGGEPWLILSPEHADILQKAGLSKAEVKRRLWQASMMPMSRFAGKDFERACHTRAVELKGREPAHASLPIAPRAEDISLVVAGGDGTHSVYVPTFGQTRSVTKPIRRS